MSDDAGGHLSALEEYDRLMAGGAPAPQEGEVSSRLPDHAEQPQPDAMLAWFARQGILEDTVLAAGVYVHAYDGVPGFVFPYVDPTTQRVVARTYRPNKVQDMQVEPGSRPALLGIERFGDHDTADMPVIIAETELEALLFREVGYSLATCAPPGMLSRALAGAASALGARTKFILAIQPVEAREEIARRLGRHRCWSIVWFPDTPNALATWQKGGRDAVIAAVEQADPWPLEGVQVIKPGTIREYRDAPEPPTLTTGTGATDDVLRFPAEGRLIIITGMPAGGKTTWSRAVMIHLMQAHGRRFMVFSPENNPWQEYVADCARLFIGKPLRRRQRPSPAPMTDAELAHAENWLHARLLLLTKDSVDQPPTLDWIFERFSGEVLRWGLTDLIIDPWNEVDHAGRGNGSIEEYIGRQLQICKGLANRHGVNVWIICHPVKLSPGKPGQKIPAPTLYDISGGAMWNNKADVGIVVHTEDNETQIIVRKIRHSPRWGRRGGIAHIVLDIDTGRYQSAIPSERVLHKKGGKLFEDGAKD